MKLDLIIEQLYQNIVKEDYKGWDPFDGLNSRFFQNSLLINSRFFRLVWIQLNKRSPINLRRLTGVDMSYNSKGLALLISGLINLYKTSQNEQFLENALYLSKIIIQNRSKDRDYFCAGYNFFWEAKAFSVPAYKPNLIVTTFCAESFLDIHKTTGEKSFLKLAIEAAAFLHKELLLIDNKEEACFGYIPGENIIVHNVNILGAKLYADLFRLTEENEYRIYSIRSLSYTLNAQQPDGSWFYGESRFHKWVDNFHTGFILCAIKDIMEILNITSPKTKLEKGLNYHMSNHFSPGLFPKYYNGKLYPVDIHNIAQGIITFTKFNMQTKARLLFEYALEQFWDEKRHYFYYQKTGSYTNKINYIRWSQAWMFYAITKLLITGDNE